jgi:hypothetical protein
VASLGPTSALMTGVLLGINTENRAGPVGLDHPGAGLVSSSHHGKAFAHYRALIVICAKSEMPVRGVLAGISVGGLRWQDIASSWF